jgi:hypothetical protein
MLENCGESIMLVSIQNEQITYINNQMKEKFFSQMAGKLNVLENNNVLSIGVFKF